MPQRNDVAIFVFQLCSLKLDADLCMRMDLPLEKKLWKIRTGPAGPRGPWAAGPSWAARPRG